jgi:hypothetical protein
MRKDKKLHKKPQKSPNLFQQHKLWTRLEAARAEMRLLCVYMGVQG